jgi:hypothetical protein
MTTLAELIKIDAIEAHWFWTHEVATGPYAEHEVWDLVIVRNSNEPQRWVTDGDTRRTAYFQGIGGSVADSRRNTGGERREPGLEQTLSDLLSDAADIDAHPTFQEWVDYHEDTAPAWRQLATYEAQTRTRDMLRAWLPDAYDTYMASWS